MATNGVNIAEDAEMAECDGDKVVTMMDVLQEQQDFEEDANAVLGASDDKNCTYSKGYIKRQAIYACLTCCPDVKTDPTKRAGVCLACSLNCHENHELVELYTKRNFRCDCGNPKFNSHPCQFTPNKTELNDDNIYNQNFSGLYCTCQRPYPDPEATFEDDMIQCIICEDWLHASHLDAVVPANDQYSEMICKACMEKNEFLHDYSNFAVNAESVDVDILTVNGDKADDSLCNGDVSKENITNGTTIFDSVLEAVTLSSGADVEMKDDKEKAETDDESRKIDEVTDTKSTDEQDNDKSDDNAKTVEADDKMDTESKNEDDSKPAETTESSDNTNIDSENVAKDTDETKNETCTDQEKEKESDDKMESEDVDKTSDASTKEENQSDDTKAEGDNTDTNKSEGQLLDDSSTLSSDNPSEEQKCSKTEESLTNTKESSVTEGNAEDIKASTDQATEETKAVETSNIEVPDTSQAEEKDTNDDKTDAVMDAIDKLLADPSEGKDNEQASEKLPENSENPDSTETQKETDVEMSESEKKDDKAPDTETANDEKLNQNETSDNKDQIENGTTDSKEKESEAGESTNTTEPSDEKSEVTDIDKGVPNGDTSQEDESKAADATATTSENKRKLSMESEETTPKKAKLDNQNCVRPKNVKRVHKGATFWASNFRQKLCTCGACITMYKDLHVLFLTDLEDTVSAYESLGKENVDAGASQYEKGLQALSSLDRIQQINALTEYNKMRDKLLEFLKSFKDRKEIVKEEDIKAFFAGMKPRREPDGVYFCR